MNDDRPRYTLTELTGLAGVTPRTVRYYLAQGLLSSAGTPGPGAKYGDGHLARLRLIRRLQKEHLPLAEIRERLAGLDDSSIARLANEESPADARPADSALDYIRRVLEPASARAFMSAPPPPAFAPPMRDDPPAPPGPPRVERAQWERIAIGPDVEIHVRRPLARLRTRQVDRLVSIARELLEEDRP
jgi:DNA-binding transcriptional MerR regulator